MAQNKNNDASSKKELHRRSKHRKRYNFEALILSNPTLKKYVSTNKFGDESINFHDANAVLVLNQSLLFHHYNLTYWEIPTGYLCPPIPGRADYIHNIADLLAKTNELKTSSENKTKILDIGVGANAIYPIIGEAEYDWSFVGSDIDDRAIASAKEIAFRNKHLKDKLELRLQEYNENIFAGIIHKGDFFEATICNPPFHASKEEAEKVNKRKRNNLLKQRVKQAETNFKGQSNELWYPGGERAFVSKMIKESSIFAHQVNWFTSLVSKSSNLDFLKEQIKKSNATEMKTIPMAQGNKISRILAWRF